MKAEMQRTQLTNWIQTVTAGNLEKRKIPLCGDGQERFYVGGTNSSVLEDIYLEEINYRGNSRLGGKYEHSCRIWKY